MAIDSDKPTAGGPRPDWNLPDVLSIAIRRVPFTPRQYKYFRSALSDYKEAIEFLVRLRGPVPIRALGPALFVGDVPVTESEAIQDNQYRFLAFNIQQLKSNAVISWGWINTPKSERKATNFRFTVK